MQDPCFVAVAGYLLPVRGDDGTFAAREVADVAPASGEIRSATSLSPARLFSLMNRGPSASA
jgi:hypothetical protein